MAPFGRRALIMSAIVLALGSCMRIYHADIAGYVKDSESSDGIDGSVVRIYLDAPDSPEADGFIIETATSTSGGNPGYYSHKILWRTSDPAFGEEGDSGTVWLGVSHEDYFAQIVQVRGIISGSVNFVRDIQLQSYEFECPSVSGRVVDEEGAGANGVRVVLDLSSTEDEEEDYADFTQTVDEVDGVYEFEGVRWRDEEGAERSSEDVSIFVSDEGYFSPSDSENPIAVSLTSDEETAVETDIVAYSASFSATVVTGRVVFFTEGSVDPPPGQNGVTVVLDLQSTEADRDYVTTTSTYEGVAGTYRFEEVDWQDSDPEPPGTDPASDVESIGLYVDDGEFYSDYDVENPLEATIPSDADTTVSTDIPVSSAMFSVAEIKGQISLGDGGAGINGIPVVLDIPSTAADPDQVVTTLNDGTTDGVFAFYDVSWFDTSPEASTDTEDASIYVSNDDYVAEHGADDAMVIELTSATSVDLTLSPIWVKKAVFDCPTVTGRIVDSDSAGIDGVRVVLDILSTAGDAEDYAVTTNTIAGAPGTYQFLDVQWRDENPDAAAADSENAEIRVADPDYEAASGALLQISLESGTDETAPADIAVVRNVAWEFSATVSGRCIFRVGDGVTIDITEIPIEGVNITIDASAGNGASLIDTSASALVVQTNSDGEFATTITWTRSRDYNPQADGPGATPPAEQDVLLIDVSYSSNATAGNIYSFTSVSAFECSSWLGTNSLPDAVDTDPNS